MAKWLMGDYGSKKKGQRPRPPQAALDAFKIIFPEQEEYDLEWWKMELGRRKAVVEGKEMPPLNGMAGGNERVPSYDWECASCRVGLAISCPMYIWDVDGNLVEASPALVGGGEDERIRD